jgi:hypothetical protein
MELGYTRGGGELVSRWSKHFYKHGPLEIYNINQYLPPTKLLKQNLLQIFDWYKNDELIWIFHVNRYASVRVSPWRSGLEYAHSIPLLVIRDDLMERSFGWDRKSEAPLALTDTIKNLPYSKVLIAEHRPKFCGSFTGNGDVSLWVSET